MRIGIILDNEILKDTRVLNECRILSLGGNEIHILCPISKSHPAFEVYNNLHIHRLKIKPKIKNILFALNNTLQLYNLLWKRAIRIFIRENNIETLHVHDLYLSKAAFYSLKNFNIQFTLDLHENYPAAVKGYKWMYEFPYKYIVRPGKWTKLERKYLKYPKNIIVLSETFMNNLLKKYEFLKKTQFVVYPNVPDLNEFDSYKIDENILPKRNDFVLFYFGTISERRGIFTAIEALKQIKNTIPSIKLLLIGPVDKLEKNRFYKTIEDPAIQNNIIYYAWKDISYLPSYILTSDICLSPIVKNDQHESGVANKVFQYMLFERPLIVSDCEPQEKIVTDENCGLVFTSENSHDLAEKIIKLYQDNVLREKMGENGKKAIDEKFNTQIAGKNLLTLYSKKELK